MFPNFMKRDPSIVTNQASLTSLGPTGHHLDSDSHGVSLIVS